MSMWDFLKKKEKEETSDNSGTENTDAAGQDKVLHAMDAGHGVPEALSKKLAEMREGQTPEFVEVEVDEQGKALDPEQAELLKTGSIVMDGETTSGDAENNQGDKSQESDEAEANDSSDSSSEGDAVVLTPRLVAAGESLGWDEARIKRVAKSDVSILEDLASQLENTESHRQDSNKDGKDGASDSTEGQAESPVLKKLREKLGDEADEVLSTIAAGVRESLASEFADVKDLKEATKKKAVAEESAARENIANQVFDMVAATYGEFGKTEDIPTTAEGELDFDSDQMKVRAAVYDQAMKFHKANGGSFELAMRDAVQHYAGGQRDQVAVRQIVKDVNRNKKRFTPRPTRRKTVKVFKSSQDKAAHIGREAKRRAGLDV